MEIITFESKAYKELDNKITAIADYIFNHMETARQSEEDMWVDSYEVCTFLKISEKTLHACGYRGLSPIPTSGTLLLQGQRDTPDAGRTPDKEHKENIDNLITNHQLYAKERGNLRKNK